MAGGCIRPVPALRFSGVRGVNPLTLFLGGGDQANGHRGKAQGGGSPSVRPGAVAAAGDVQDRDVDVSVLVHGVDEDLEKTDKCDAGLAAVVQSFGVVVDG